MPGGRAGLRCRRSSSTRPRASDCSSAEKGAPAGSKPGSVPALMFAGAKLSWTGMNTTNAPLAERIPVAKVKACLSLASTLGALGLLHWIWIGFLRAAQVEGCDPWLHESVGWFWLILLPGAVFVVDSLVELRRAWKGSPPRAAGLIGSGVLSLALLLAGAYLLLAGLDWPRGWEHATVATRLNDRGRYDEALRHYEKAVAIAGEDVDTLTGMGIAYAGLNRLDDAGAAFDRVIEVMPDHALARLGRARVRRLLGDKEGARQDLDAASRHAPPGWIETPLLNGERTALNP